MIPLMISSPLTKILNKFPWNMTMPSTASGHTIHDNESRFQKKK